MENNESKPTGCIVIIVIVILVWMVSTCQDCSNNQAYKKTEKERIEKEAKELEENEKRIAEETEKAGILFKKVTPFVMKLTQIKEDSLKYFESLYDSLNRDFITLTPQQQAVIDHLHILPCTKTMKVDICDEFDYSVIRSENRQMKFTFREYMENIEYKTGVLTEKKGFANSTNRKAYNLQQEYGWDSNDCLSIARGRISIGMTPEMVVKSWGRPRDINRTTSSYGVNEQWVYGTYGGSYVYFDGESRSTMVVTTIQN